ncbi:MAG TPA: MauE/DoxX family redox-associated membrane protein, partial [Chitinophagaceae bacterium]
MKNSLCKIWIVEIISVSLIVLFVYAAVSKLADYSTFKLQLSRSPFIFPIAKMVAWMIPSIELA